MRGRSEVNKILDKKENLMLNTFSLNGEISEEDFAEQANLSLEKSKELEEEALSLISRNYNSKGKTERDIEITDLNLLITEDDLPLEFFSELMLIVLNKRRELNLEAHSHGS